MRGAVDTAINALGLVGAVSLAVVALRADRLATLLARLDALAGDPGAPVQTADIAAARAALHAREGRWRFPLFLLLRFGAFAAALSYVLALWKLYR